MYYLNQISENIKEIKFSVNVGFRYIFRTAFMIFRCEEAIQKYDLLLEEKFAFREKIISLRDEIHLLASS